MKKLPPIEKIYEAFSAVADDRVKIAESSTLVEGEATVSSSDNSRTYTIRWIDGTYSSNDNSTFWQQYPGYPVLAVLMKQGLLPYSDEIGDYFKNVNWKQINTRYKNNYSLALDEVLKLKGLDSPEMTDERKKITVEAQNVYDRLQMLDLHVARLYKSGG